MTPSSPRLVEEHLPTARTSIECLTGEQSIEIRLPDGTYATPATAKFFADKAKAEAPAPATADERTAAYIKARRQQRQS